MPGVKEKTDTMKIVIVSIYFSEKMGYVENCLPKAMASFGHDVHVISSNVQPCFDKPFYKETYEPLIGPGIQPCGVKVVDGVTIHRLPYLQQRGFLGIRGLAAKLAELGPDIVQTFTPASLWTYQAATAKLRHGFKLFTGCHYC